MEAIEQYVPVVLLIMLYKVVLTCESVDQLLSCGAVYYAVQGGSKLCVCGWNPKV